MKRLLLQTGIPALILSLGLVCLPASAADDAASASQTRNKELVKRLFSEVYNARDLALISQFFAPGFVHRDALMLQIGLLEFKMAAK